MWVASLDGMTPYIYSSPSALGSKRKPGRQPKTGTAMTAEIIPFRPPAPGLQSMRSKIEPVTARQAFLHFFFSMRSGMAGRFGGRSA